MNIPFAFDMQEAFSKPQELLAIVGGTAVGALASGLLAQLLSRWLTTRKLPHLATLASRIVGGAAVGLLTAMWVLQGGTWGPGGPGGPGTPSTPGAGDVKPEDKNSDKPSVERPNNTDKPPDDAGPPVPPESILRIKVLTDAALRQLVDDQAVKDARFYLLVGDKDAKDPLSLDSAHGTSVRRIIETRMTANPPLRQLDVVLPPNNVNSGRVYLLLELANKKGLKHTTETPPE